jgi:hypothetical protein
MLHAPVVIAADYAGTFEVGDTSELRARITSQATGGQSGESGMDAYTQPRVRLRVATRDDWELVLGNAPIVTWDNIELGACSTCVTVYDTLDASVGWHDRTVSISLSEYASGGGFNTAAGPLPQPTPTPAQMAGQMPGQVPTQMPGQVPGQMPTQMPPPQLLVPNNASAPTSAVIVSESTHTALTLRAQLDRIDSLSLEIAYLTSGGLDAKSRTYFPEQYGPRADASFAHALSRRDQAVTLAYASAAQFASGQCYDSVTGAVGTGQCSPAAQVAQISEGIRHTIDRATTFSADVGIAGTRTRSTDSVSYEENLYPVGTLELAHHFGLERKSSILLGAYIAPVLDWRTGIVNERLRGHIALTEALTALVTLRATVDGSQTIPTDAPLATSLIGGLAEVVYQSSRNVLLTVGLRAWWQQQSQFGTYSSYILYFDVTALAPALRF